MEKVGTNIVQILETGVSSNVQFTAKIKAVTACLARLEEMGFKIPTFSSLLIQATKEDERDDFAGFCARIAKNNQDDVV